MNRRLKVIIGVVVGLVVLFVGGPFIYINFIEGEPEKELTVDDATGTTVAGATATTVAAPSSFDGTWNVASSSQAGYRVKETLFGQSTTAVGRTTAVTGTMTVSGSTVSATAITVDMTKVASDQSQRDGQFRNRIMETSKFPTASFTLTKPITLDAVPGDGSSTTTKATGDLLLHGVTKSVTVDLTIKRTGGTIAVSGSIPITFGDYGINNPSGGPATVGDEGDLEFAVAFAKA